METTPSPHQKRPNPSLPPKRGRIKEQIFENLIRSLSSAASKAGETFGKIKRVGSAGGSTSTAPPSSIDTSDGYSDHA